MNVIGEPFIPRLLRQDCPGMA